MSIQWWPYVSEAILALDKVCKAYDVGALVETEVLHDIDLAIRRSEFVALMGPSGSGKSTLLNIIGLLDRPTRGRLYINGQDTSALEEAELTRLRNHSIGFVFQYHHLITAFTALENVMIPMLVDRVFPSVDIKRRAANLMEQLGLTSVANNPALNISGGQQQRVAVARALAMSPDIVLADEPTGNLDTKSADRVFELLRQANQRHGTTLLLVTHNTNLASRCDRIIELVDGRIDAAGET
jgi:lipoprotein-releasing system ATP-binding protein